MFKFIGTLSFIWLVMAISAAAQNPVLDTDGQPLQRGVEYYVLPAITDVAGGLTLVNRTSPCPLYVGQERLPTVATTGLPVIFRPFVNGENVIGESRDLSIEFSASTTCVQSTQWRIGETDPASNRRFIVTGGGVSYFRIDNNGGIYNIVWCPGESCGRPNCPRPRCGSAGILIENGKRFLALDAPIAFPFQFTKA